jgi:quinol monooxygenase YgiN
MMIIVAPLVSLTLRKEKMTMRKSILLAAAATLVLGCPVFAGDKEPEIISRLKKAKVEGPFNLAVLIKAKEGEEKALLKAAKPCIASSRKEKGCLHYEVLQDIENPRQFVFYERWKSIQDLADHMTTEHFKKLVGDLSDVVDGEPRIVLLRKTDKE